MPPRVAPDPARWVMVRPPADGFRVIPRASIEYMSFVSSMAEVSRVRRVFAGMSVNDMLEQTVRPFVSCLQKMYRVGAGRILAERDAICFLRAVVLLGLSSKEARLSEFYENDPLDGGVVPSLAGVIPYRTLMDIADNVREFSTSEVVAPELDLSKSALRDAYEEIANFCSLLFGRDQGSLEYRRRIWRLGLTVDDEHAPFGGAKGRSPWTSTPRKPGRSSTTLRFFICFGR